MRNHKVWAVVYSYETIGNSREDILDSWFNSKREAANRLKEQELRYPRTDKNHLYLCPAIAWQDDEFSHWHVKRAQL